MSASGASYVAPEGEGDRMKRHGVDLPKLILYLALMMIAVGILLHGVRPAVFLRAWNNLLARPGQSLALRFILQPLMSTIIATRDGIKDARTGRSPYLWTIVSDPAQRVTRLREGIAATGKILLIAIALDVAYQSLELNAFYPGEALLIAVLLAFVPYLIVRELVARLGRSRLRDRATKPSP
jgi:hypothetical protein